MGETGSSCQRERESVSWQVVSSRQRKRKCGSEEGREREVFSSNHRERECRIERWEVISSHQRERETGISKTNLLIEGPVGETVSSCQRERESGS